MRILTVNSRCLSAALIATCLYASVYGVVSWNQPPIQVSKTSDAQGTSQEAIASDGVNTVMAAWIQGVDTGDNDNRNVYAASYNVATQTWSEPDRLTNNGKCKQPKIVLLGDNEAFVTYVQGDDDGTNALNGILYKPGNTVPGSGIEINSNVHWDQNQQSTNVHASAAYLDKHVLVAFCNGGNNNKDIFMYDIIAPTYTKIPNDDTGVKVSAGAPDTGDACRRINPFLAIQPITNVILIVWAQKGPECSGGFPVGVQVPYPLAEPNTNAFTLFQPQDTSTSPFRESLFPQILFNPADNMPFVFYQVRFDTDPQPAILGAGQWTNYLASSHTAQERNDNFDLISTEPLSNSGGEDEEPFRFFVTINGPNFFTVVYQQNLRDTASDFVYGTSYIPGHDSPSNDKISSVAAGNREAFTPVQAICPSTSGQYLNVVVWPEDNKVYGALYAPGSQPTGKTQLSTIGEVALPIDATNDWINFIVLALAGNGSQAIPLWNQFPDDETQLFGTTANISCPAQFTVTASQVLHRFPRCGDLTNVLSIASKDSYVSYVIYLSPDLTTPLVTLDASKANPTVYTQYGVKPCTEYKYYIYGVDSFGNKSEAVIVTFPASA